MEINYSDLKSKDVINVQTGAKYGHIVDMVIDINTKVVLGIVAPSSHRLFHTGDDIFIPWKNIAKIGKDVILVNLTTKCVEHSDCDDDFI